MKYVLSFLLGALLATVLTVTAQQNYATTQSADICYCSNGLPISFAAQGGSTVTSAALPSGVASTTLPVPGAAPPSSALSPYWPTEEQKHSWLLSDTGWVEWRYAFSSTFTSPSCFINPLNWDLTGPCLPAPQMHTIKVL